MKIGLAHNLYGKYSHGGAETAVSLMAAEFKKAGHEVFLITTKPKKEKAAKKTGGNESNKSETTNAGTDLKIYYLDSCFYNLAALNIAARFFFQIGNIISLKKYRAVKKILKAEKPELIITHNLMGLGFLMPLAIRKLKIRHEHFLHDIQLLYPSGLMIYGRENILNSLSAKIYQSLTRMLFASPAKVISPSKWLLDLHVEYGFFKKSAIEVRPFKWTENNNLNSEQKRKPAAEKLNNFLFVGQIEEQKGILFLIETFKKITDPELKLTIASSTGGKKLNEAKKLSANDQRIKILCPYSYDETKKLMENSDCLIVPSLCYENSPTVIYGAQAAGLKVIASNIGGIPEICTEHDLLFEPGNEQDLIDKMAL